MRHPVHVLDRPIKHGHIRTLDALCDIIARSNRQLVTSNGQQNEKLCPGVATYEHSVKTKKGFYWNGGASMNRIQRNIGEARTETLQFGGYKQTKTRKS